MVFAIGSVLIWVFESGVKGGGINGFGDAVFFTAVQLLTISSSITNPLTAGGKIVDVALEAWAIFVVTAVAGSFASFFSSGDSGAITRLEERGLIEPLGEEQRRRPYRLTAAGEAQLAEAVQAMSSIAREGAARLGLRLPTGHVQMGWLA